MQGFVMKRPLIDRIAIAAAERVSRREALRRGAGVLGAGMAAGAGFGFFGGSVTSPARASNCNDTRRSKACHRICDDVNGMMEGLCNEIYAGDEADRIECLTKNASNASYADCFQDCTTNSKNDYFGPPPCPGQACNPDTGICEPVPA
jgi:hypothetical protein